MYRVLSKFLNADADVFPGFGSDEQIERLDIWTGAQQFLYEDFAQKSCCSGNEHIAIPIKFGNGRMLHLGSVCLLFVVFVRCVNFFSS